MASVPKSRDTLSKQLSNPAHTVTRIRAARDAVLQRVHLQKRLHNMQAVVREAYTHKDEHKRDQILANSLFPAVEELVQDHDVAGDITRYVISKGDEFIMEICGSVESFTGKIKALETATEHDETLRTAMNARPRNQAQDGVDYSPRSSPTSLFEQWCSTWDADTDPNKLRSLKWKREAITALVQLYAPSGSTASQKNMMVEILAADNNTDKQEWFSGMLVNPPVAFELATAAILEGHDWNAVTDHLRGGLGDGAAQPPFVVSGAHMVFANRQHEQSESAGHDSDDVTVDTRSRDSTGEQVVIVPDTPPTTDENMDMDEDWNIANEQARLTAAAPPAGEKHARLSSPSSGELFPAKRNGTEDEATSFRGSQTQKTAGDTQQTATSGPAQQTMAAKKGTFLVTKSGSAPARQSAAKAPSHATSTSAADQAQGRAK
jgi:hypothetical protein